MLIKSGLQIPTNENTAKQGTIKKRLLLRFSSKDVNTCVIVSSPSNLKAN